MWFEWLAVPIWHIQNGHPFPNNFVQWNEFNLKSWVILWYPILASHYANLKKLYSSFDVNVLERRLMHWSIHKILKAKTVAQWHRSKKSNASNYIFVDFSHTIFKEWFNNKHWKPAHSPQSLKSTRCWFI